MMVIAEGRHVSYHTINNFRSSDHADRLIKESFVHFINLLQEEGLIREDAIFIDEAKIEADFLNIYNELIQKEVELAISEEKIQKLDEPIE